jgi:hypothetical protein
MSRDEEDLQESRRLVRVYSSDVAGRIPPGSNAERLGRVLSRDRPASRDLPGPWRKFFEPCALDGIPE